MIPVSGDMRYFTFDYNAGTVIEWERTGECNGCAACCTTVIRWQIDMNSQLPGWDGRNGATTTDRQGRETGVYINGRWRFFKSLEVTTESHRCSMLTANNRCIVHTGKRLISRAWPMAPEHVTPFPQCSYSFQEVGRWTVEEFFS